MSAASNLIEALDLKYGTRFPDSRDLQTYAIKGALMVMLEILCEAHPITALTIQRHADQVASGRPAAVQIEDGRVVDPQPEA